MNRSFLAKLRDEAVALLRCDRGNYALIFGLLAIPLVAMAGIAVDAARIYLAQERLQEAIDRAALAAGGSTETNEGKLKNLARQVFDMNFSGEGTVSAFDLKSDSVKNTVTVEATVSIDAAMTAIVGHDTLTVARSTEVTRHMTGIEAVLVLDVTGSMWGSSIEALRSAGNDFLDAVYRLNATDEKVRVAIVPYQPVDEIPPL